MISKIREPFQHKKIDLNNVEVKDVTITGRRKGERTKNWWTTIQRIWAYLAKMKGRLILVLTLVVISSALALLGPFLVGKGIDDYIVRQDRGGFLLLLFTLVAIYIFHSISVWLQNFTMVQ